MITETAIMQQIVPGKGADDGSASAVEPDRPEVVYTTCPSMEVAEAIGRALVEARLVACANVLPGMRSVYAWEGAIETGDEVVMILKTRRACVAEVVRAVEDRHPFDTPAVLSWPATGGSGPYIDWIAAETRDEDAA